MDIDPALADLVAKYPLPAGVLDADMNQDEMASALSTTVNSISKWLRSEGMPMVQEGGLGKAYVLRLSHCWAWKAGRDDADHQRRNHNADQISMLQASFLGFDAENPLASLSAKDRTQLAQADIQHSRAMQMRRQLVRLDEVVELLESLFTETRNMIEAMPDVLERELSLKPEEVAKVDRIGTDLLTALSEKIEAAELTERDVPDIEVQRQWTI